MLKRISSLQNHMINVLLAALGGFSLIYALTTSLHFNHNPFAIFGAVFGLLLVYSLLFINKVSTLCVLALSVLSALAGSVYLYHKELLLAYLYKAVAYVLWIYNYTQGLETLNTRYALSTLALLALTFSLFVFFFAVKRFNFYVLLAVGISIFVSQWTLNYLVSYIPFYLFLFIILIYYMKFIFISSTSDEGGEYAHPAQFTLWIAPLCIVAVSLVALFFPMSERPIEWPWLDKKIVAAYNYFYREYRSFKSYDYFSLATSGFGSTGSLGGKVKLDKTVVMKVEAPRQIYLKGVVKDLYTGSAWINTAADQPQLPIANVNNPLRLDFYEMLNRFLFIDRLTEVEYNKYFFKDTVKITFKDMKTKTLFVANKNEKIIFGKPSSVDAQVDLNGTLTSRQKLGSDFSYTLQVYNPKYSSTEFIELLRQSKPGYYLEKFAPDIDRFNTLLGRDILTANPDLRHYSFNFVLQENPLRNASSLQLMNTAFSTVNDVYSRYLQLPEQLPERVKKLARDITAGKTTDYDRVKAIEEYLSAGFPYTLTPKATPKNRDFVDYFLFDLKEGYCSYYATAMTIMTRSLGIPARYVEGYILPPKASSGSTYEVTNEQAHAWVEVYFEGFGWIPFESTSPFQSAFYANRDMQGVYTGSFESSLDYMQYLMRIKGYSESELDLSALEDLQDQDNRKWYRNVLLIPLTLLGLLLLLLAVLLLNWIRRKIKLRRLKNSSPRDSILGFYHYYLEIMALEDIKIVPGETPSEFAERVARLIPMAPVGFKTVTGIFINARFSENEISDKDKAVVCQFHDSLISKMKAGMSKRNYLFFRYILGRF